MYVLTELQQNWSSLLVIILINQKQARSDRHCKMSNFCFTFNEFYRICWMICDRDFLNGDNWGRIQGAVGLDLTYGRWACKSLFLAVSMSCFNVILNSLDFLIIYQTMPIWRITTVHFGVLKICLFCPLSLPTSGESVPRILRTWGRQLVLPTETGPNSGRRRGHCPATWGKHPYTQPGHSSTSSLCKGK